MRFVIRCRAGRVRTTSDKAAIGFRAGRQSQLGHGILAEQRRARVGLVERPPLLDTRERPYRPNEGVHHVHGTRTVGGALDRQRHLSVRGRYGPTAIRQADQEMLRKSF